MTTPDPNPPVVMARPGKKRGKSSKPAAADGETKDLSKRSVQDYVELIETVARVEYSRLPNHLIDYSELVNIGAIAIHVLLTANPMRDFNITYLSTSIKWAIRNELRYRYKWYALKTAADAKPADDEAPSDGDGTATGGSEETQRTQIREAVYETILSVDGMMEAENPHEIRDDSYTPEEHSELKELSLVIRDAISRLPEREKQIIEARFYKNMKMREIGDMFNISPSRISRIVQSGLDKIKVDLIKRGYS